MSTLRFDVTTGDWVAFSSVRASRPDELRPQSVRPLVIPEHDPNCPFCPGNEASTPTATCVEPDPQDASRWCVRVVPNKYPVLEPIGTNERRLHGPLFREMDGFGRHELVIESPSHARTLADQPLAQVERLLACLHRRSSELAREKSLEVVQIFKNHGARAGSSLRHPHFQILATPVVPRQVRIKYERASDYYQVTGESVYSALCRAELAAATRVVVENSEFVAFVPFAARTPYEMWIVPLRAAPSFDAVEPAALGALAQILSQALRALRSALLDPPYNLVITSAPQRHVDEPDFVWHLEIVPRVATAAGFELATGMAINSVFPEEAAANLRAAAQPPAPSAL